MLSAGREDQINFYFQWLVKRNEGAVCAFLLSDLRDEANLFARRGWQSAQHVVSLLVASSAVWTQLVTPTGAGTERDGKFRHVCCTNSCHQR
jgi:hypothetical protein